MAAVTFRYPATQNAVQKSLGAALDTGVTASMTLNNTTNVQNKPGICVVDRIDSSGALKTTSVREFIAYAGTSGATLTTLTRNVDNSSSDQDHAIGAIVEFIPDVTFAQAILDVLDGTKSGVTLLSPTISTITNTGTVTLPTATTTLVGRDTTDTLTNKRRTRRVVTVTQSATPTVNTDNTDVASITGLAQAITSMTTNLSGTPVAGDLLEFQITDNGSARAITWGSSFEATTVALPTTTVISTMLRVLFEWNATASKWDCIATC